MMAALTLRRLFPVLALVLVLVALISLMFIGAAAAQDPDGPPARPTGLAVSTEQGSLDVAVDWDDTDGATSYLVRWREAGPDNDLNEGVTVQSSTADITVAEAGRWVVRVEACNDAGCGLGVAQMVSIVPPRPVNLTLADTGDLEISTSWEAASGADDYKVLWRKHDGDFQDGDAATVTDTGAAITVSEAGLWVVRVEGCNSVGCGPGANGAVRVSPPPPPAMPAGLVVTTEPGSLEVSADWDDTDRATSYRVRWRDAVAGNELNAGVTVDLSNATITMTEASQWVVRVEACNDGGCGPGVSKQIDMVPGEPGDLALADTGDLGISASWEAAAGADEYKVLWRRHDGNFQDGDAAMVTINSAAITVSEAGLWVVRVEACNAAGCGPGSNAAVSVAPPEPPAAPTGLTVTIEPGSLDVAVDWDDLDGATSYLVRWRRHNGGFLAENEVATTHTTAAIVVSDNGPWVVQVKGCNDGGCGLGAAQWFAITPATPGNLTLTDTGNLGISASWEAVAGADEYKVQ